MRPTSWTRWARASLLAALTVIAGACAGATQGAAAGEGAVTVRVENNLIPSTSLSVYAIPDVGGRRLVGVVDPSRTATLSFNPVGPTGEYRFVAETTAGAEIVSNPVVIGRGETVVWDVSANIAVVR